MFDFSLIINLIEEDALGGVGIKKQHDDNLPVYLLGH